MCTFITRFSTTHEQNSIVYMITQIEMSTITSTATSSQLSSSKPATLLELRELAKAEAAQQGKPRRADAKPKAPADECPALPKKRKEPVKGTTPSEEDADTSSAPKKAKRNSKMPRSQHEAGRPKEKPEPNVICGSYNFQGCVREPCHRKHVFDKKAQNAKAVFDIAKWGRNMQLGMWPKSKYAPEL